MKKLSVSASVRDNKLEYVLNIFCNETLISVNPTTVSKGERAVRSASVGW